ncbi:hypothetical protein AVEN_230672-1 [Araneus ventricosus]|uniref:Uncharacterized protein n=1 Tax=Araneus ventricosus TaxID=182803 RepID=A0A4Y2A3Y6_ARAVE|nr:hypothetical protein AVEN_230672-1 [Araneus ventricosus]
MNVLVVFCLNGQEAPKMCRGENPLGRSLALRGVARETISPLWCGSTNTPNPPVHPPSQKEGECPLIPSEWTTEIVQRTLADVNPVRCVKPTRLIVQ